MSRILAIGDTHCGHWSGLTPPAWQPSINREGWGGRVKLEREAWRRFRQIITDEGPFDWGFHLGDAIDGNAYRSGGVELITADRDEQAAMAVAVMNSCNVQRGWAMVYGTPYHAGNVEDWESIVAREMGAEIHGHWWPQIDGVTFDIKHKIGKTGTPTGGDIMLRKERLWNEQWYLQGMQPLADVYLRGHVHEYRTINGPGAADRPPWRVATAPGLQWGTKYGERQCSGIIHWGAIIIETEDGRVTRWDPKIIRLKSAVATAKKLS